ncbi:MAG: hypothetical protein JNM31_13265 [Flavobacteriales bacterium]|nr:hypothetical protein [Flavobacteriales bacterium]
MVTEAKDQLNRLLVAGLSGVLPLLGLAQGKYGSTPADSAKCVECLSLYQEFVKQNSLEDAVAHWHCALNLCPASRKGLYVDGARIRKYQIDKQKDAAQKAKLVDSLYALYDMRIQYFGEKGYVLGRKALDMLRYTPERKEQIFNTLKESLAERGSSSEANALLAYYQVLNMLYGDSKATKKQMLEDFVMVMGFIDVNLAKPDMKPEDKELYMKARDGVSELFFKVAECPDIARIAEDLSKERPGDMEVRRRLLKALNAKDCTEEPIYRTMAEEVHRASPTHESAYSNAMLRVKQQQWSPALEYLREAIELCTDCPDRVKYLLKAGQVASAAGNNVQARSYAERVLQVEPKNGEAMMLIGNAVAAAAAGCEGIMSKMVYCLAYDQYAKARSADPSVADRAAERMASCAARFPTQEEAFFNQLKEGANYQVDCGGLTGTTTVRIKK